MAAQPSVVHKADIKSILETVGRLYASEGARGANIRSIASQVGLAPSALYYYFGSKQRMIQMALSEMGGVARRSLHEAGDSVDDEDQKFERLVCRNLEVLAFDAKYAPIHSRQVVSFANGESQYFPVEDYRGGVQEFVGLRPSGAAPTDARTGFMLCALVHGFAELSRLEKQLAGGGAFTEQEKDDLRRELLAAARAIALGPSPAET